MPKQRLIAPITQDQLKEILSYDPQTGIFRWLVPRPPKAIGDIAGTIKTNGYRAIMIRKKQYYAHRLAFFYMTRTWPPDGVDHINLTPDDNRWANLRPATDGQNVCNTARRSDNTSGFKGVSWSKVAGRWTAFIRNKGKRRGLGLFDTPEEAYQAYCTAACAEHGAFARLF